MRLMTPAGMSNSAWFFVGETALNTVSHPPTIKKGERENRPNPTGNSWNGRIMPGESDRFVVEANKGQRVVVRFRPAHLIPYLAECSSRLVSSNHCAIRSEGKSKSHMPMINQFDPDPVLFLRKFRRLGRYHLEIKGCDYRGREISFTGSPLGTALRHGTYSSGHRRA